MWSGLSGVEGPGKERPVSNSKGVKPGILLTEERTDINTNRRTDNHVNLVRAQILANFHCRRGEKVKAAEFTNDMTDTLFFTICLNGVVSETYIGM